MLIFLKFDLPLSVLMVVFLRLISHTNKSKAQRDVKRLSGITGIYCGL